VARKKPAEERSGGAPEWMITYSDLVSLLMTFFVLLYSMSSIASERFESAAQSIRGALNMFSRQGGGGGMFGQNSGDALISITERTNARENADEPPPEPGSKEYEEMLIGMIAELEGEIKGLNTELEGLREEAAAGEAEGGDLDKTGKGDENSNEEFDLTEEDIIQLEIIEERRRKLDEFMQSILEESERLGIGGYVSIVNQEERLVLRLNSQILFDSGSASLRARGLEVMLALGESFRDLDHNIEVQGHTDSRPIRTTQFPSNWELSTQRATNVVRILQDECGVPPTRLRSTGFGEYQPIGDNATDEGRQSNRRIDIVITTI